MQTNYHTYSHATELTVTINLETMGTADHPESRDKVICGHFIFRGIDPIRQSLTKSDGNGRIREASRMHMHQGSYRFTTESRIWFSREF